MKNVLLVLLLISPVLLFSQVNVLGPYLQNADSTSIVTMWETNSSTASKVSYGLTTALGNEATGSSVTGGLLSKVHTVKIEGLQPDTKYYYSVNFGNKYSDTIPFITPPLSNSEKSFGMIAFSDMQRDAANANQFQRVINDGVLDYAETLPGNSLPEKLAYVLVPGDLVDFSFEFPTNTYKTNFFTPGRRLFEMVPVYPILGNHEYIGVVDPFFKYFDLPKNGTDGYKEQWWFKDYSNTRIIGLQSNANALNASGKQAQYDWLQSVLDDACANADIDFVFAQIHHPFHSEMWGPGNEAITGNVITLMEDFSTSCGKPSIHFFGHTHSYARGQSKDHQHLMVNVASAGGKLDVWGDGDDQDYEEYSKGISDYGFVYLEVIAGTEPKFTLKRISRGNPQNPMDNVVRDSIVVFKNGLNPDKPIAIEPIDVELNPDCVLLEAGAFASNSGGALHGESQWQIAENCNGFDSPIIDIWKNYENIIAGVNEQANDDLTDQDINGLSPYSSYCWRVRYRDRNLRWSEWSDPSTFTTGQPINLLKNSGAELGLQDWVVTQGIMESLAAFECDGSVPYKGSKYFVVGTACYLNNYSEAHQIVDVSSYATSIDAGSEDVHFGGYLSDYSNFDLPQFRLTFLDENDVETGQTQKFGNRHNVWRAYDEVKTVPANTRKIKFELFGTKGVLGYANDCYFDELYLVVDSATSKIDTTICAGETVIVLGEEFTESGSYTVADPNGEDCSSHVQVNVTVSDTSFTALNEFICPDDSFQVGEQFFSETGTYVIVLTNRDDCDSTIELNLTILGATDVGCTTGFNDFIIKDLVELYPNPFTSSAVLKLRYLPKNNLELKVFNDIGESVSVYSNISSNVIQINRGELASGVYFYVLGKGSEVYARGNFVVKD